MRIAFFGDVVGRSGRRGLARIVRTLRKSTDVIVANCENAAHGKGVSPRVAEELRDAGIDVLTSGNHVWHDRSIIPYLDESTRLIRPLNLPPGTPGRGWTVVAEQDRSPVAVVNLIGRVFMGPADCPFRAVEAVLDEVARITPIIIVDMHAEATSEKVALARFLDGKVTAVVGTHTHVQTADEGILSAGTASITDVGMCGPRDSVLGVRTDRAIQRFRSPVSQRFEVAEGESLVQGVTIDVDAESGRAQSIARIREIVQL